MGFRSGVHAKVWDVKPVSNAITQLRISISHRVKDRNGQFTNEYEDDFSGFVSCIGTATAAKALGLKAGDRIKLGDVDVTVVYDKVKKVTYTNFKVFGFETGEAGTSSDVPQRGEPSPSVDSGDVEDDDLPF